MSVPAEIGWWKLAGDLNDYSGNGNHGAWQGGGAASYAAGPDGGASGAVSFDGSHYIEIADDAVLHQTTAFSFAVWIKRTAGDLTWNGFCGKYDQSAIAGWGLGTHDDNNKFKIVFRKDTDNYWSANSNTVIVNGTWYHLAVVYAGDGTTPRLFIDGVEETGLSTWLVAGNGLNGITDSGQAMEIGREDLFAPRHRLSECDIADLRIYPVLTPGQVKSLWNEGYGTDQSLADLYAVNSGIIRPVLQLG
jgi:hypothetical protein